MALVTGLVFSLAAGAALACTCVTYSPDYLRRHSSLVVVGEVSSADPVEVVSPEGWTDEAAFILVAHREKGGDRSRRLKVTWQRGGDVLECDCMPAMPDAKERHRFYLRPKEGLPGVYELWGLGPPD